MRLSVVFITKNEAEYMEAALQQLQGWADEIVVVDDFSTDDTVSIASRYTDRIYTRKLDTFSRQRNFGQKKTTGDWVLSLDPDERLSDALKDEIKQAMACREYAAYAIPFRHYWFGDWLRFGYWHPSYLKRLFWRDAAFWKNDVHETLTVNGTIGRLKEAIDHYGHETMDKVLRKIVFYAKCESVERERQGRLPTLFGPGKTFCNRYFLRLGFLDGTRGLIVNFLMFFYVFLIRAYYIERKYRR